jgi:hypothetical protein
MSKQDETTRNFVIHRGPRVFGGRPEKIREAQTITHYDIGGRSFERIRYGNEPEDWDANKRPCHDCRVIKGEYHVVGCDVERCPRCTGQAISCDCLDEEDDESVPDAAK